MKNKKGLSEIVVTLIIILLSLVSIAVVWVVVNKLVNENQYEFKITEKVCNNETSLISTTLISSEKIIINHTFHLHNYRDVYYFSEFENEIQDTYTEDYKVEVSKFINSTYFDLETGEIKEYNYLLSDFETPIKLVKNEEIGFIYKEILDISPENFFGKEITLEFEVWHNKYNYSYETKEFCEEKEVDEIFIENKTILDNEELEVYIYCDSNKENPLGCGLQNISNEKLEKVFCSNYSKDVICNYYYAEGFNTNITKKFLQEHPEWLDENCECWAVRRINYGVIDWIYGNKKEVDRGERVVIIPENIFKNREYLSFPDGVTSGFNSKSWKCSKYSCGNYTVEVKNG